MILATVVISSLVISFVESATVNVVLDGKLHILESGRRISEFATVLKQYISNPNEAIIYYKDKILDLGTGHDIEFADNDHLYIYSKVGKKSASPLDLFSTLFKAYMNSQFVKDKSKNRSDGKDTSKDENKRYEDNDQLVETLKKLASSPMLWDSIMKYATPENMAILSNALNNSKSYYDKIKTKPQGNDNVNKSTPKDDL